MNTLKTIGLTALLAVAAVPAAHAADAFTVPDIPVTDPLAVYNDPGFNWSGFYAGVMGVVQDNPAGWEYGPGIVAGVNTQLDYFVLGAEAGLTGLTDGTNWRGYGQVLGRGGVVVTDEVLAYAALGFGADLSATNNRHFLAGGGLEVAVTDAVSIKAQYLRGIPVDAVSTPVNQFSIGANFHF